MGRIAEALKRAHEERARRIPPGADALAGGAADAPGPLGFAAERKPTVALMKGVLGPARGLSTVAHPAPLPAHAPPLAPDAVAPEVLVFHAPSSPIAEKYRSVRTRLLTANQEGSARTFAITSTLPKEGKTTTTANLGFSFAELRHLRIAMVDLEFRQRGLSRLFGVGDRPGIIDVLRGQKRLTEVCIPVVRDNLFLIPAGQPGDAGPSELLAGPAALASSRELNELFHYTLIDTPPVNTVADIGLIAPLCHSVVIVVRMNRTPEPLLCRSVKMLQANRVSIAGCILAGYSDEGLNLADTHDYYNAEA